MQPRTVPAACLTCRRRSHLCPVVLAVRLRAAVVRAVCLRVAVVRAVCLRAAVATAPPAVHTVVASSDR